MDQSHHVPQLAAQSEWFLPAGLHLLSLSVLIHQ